MISYIASTQQCAKKSSYQPDPGPRCLSVVLGSCVQRTTSVDDVSRCIFDGNGHEKINIPSAHQRNVAA